MKAERRHEARVRAFNLVDVGELNDVGLLKELTMGRTLDLSHDGMRLELSHALPVGAEATLDLELGERIIEVRGRVRSVEKLSGTRHYAMGLEFLDLDPASYEQLDEYLQLRGWT